MASFDELVRAARATYEFADLEPEVQTDRDLTKAVPCRECGRPLIVTAFYSANNARCHTCKPKEAASGRGEVANPRPGVTDPSKALHLADCLVNPGFGAALCPVHPDDPEHTMELKMVTHSDAYGPSEFMGYKNGLPVYRREATGESVMHQCLKCKATVSYSTTAQVQYARTNEPRRALAINPNGTFEQILGAKP